MLADFDSVAAVIKLKQPIVTTIATVTAIIAIERIITKQTIEKIEIMEVNY